MTCTEGHPVHWVGEGTEDGGCWYHDKLGDAMSCTAVDEHGNVAVAE